MSVKFRRSDLHEVGPAPSEQSSSYFRVGDAITSSGIYRAIHGDHRVAHEITLLSGDVFPRCRKCGKDVIFELVVAAPAANRDRAFRVRLYEIPHPEVPDPSVEVA